MKTTATRVLALLLTASASFAQDIHFSQFNMTPLLLNPAQSGCGHDIQAIVNYKDQWKSVASPYKTFDISYDMKFGKDPKSGFFAAGLLFYSDKAGDVKLGTTQANLNLAYHVILDQRSTLGLGVMGGFGQRSISYTDMQWGAQYDGSSYNSSLASGEPAGMNKFTYPDMGAGLVYNYRKAERYSTGNDQLRINAGVSLFHPLQPENSFYNSGEKLFMKYGGHIQAHVGIKNSQLSLSPGMMYFRQGPAQEILFGGSLMYMLKEESKYTGYVKGAAFSLGGFYRNKDAVVITSLLEFGNYALGVSYDINISDLSSASSGRGGLEISLRFLSPSPFMFKSSSSF